MRQLNDQTLFTFVEKNANQQNPSATLTSALYSIIFSHNNDKSSNHSSSNNLTTTSDNNVKTKRQNQQAKSQSQQNLSSSKTTTYTSTSTTITQSSDDIAASSDTYSLAYTSLLANRQRANFGLNDWFVRSESDCNLILEYDSDLENQSVTICQQPEKLHNANSHSKQSVILFNNYKNNCSTRSLSSACVDTIDLNGCETSSSNDINKTKPIQILNSDSSNIINNHKPFQSNKSSRATIDTSIEGYEKIAPSINPLSSLDQNFDESYSVTSCYRLSLIESSNINNQNNISLGTIDNQLTEQTAENNINNNNSRTSSPDHQLPLEDLLRNESSDEDDWIFLGVNDNKTTNHPSSPTNISIIPTTTDNTLDQSSFTKTSTKQQSLLLQPKLSANNIQQYSHYIQLYKDLLKERYANEYIGDIDLTHFQIMALDMKDIDLIRESWKPVRKDIVVYGIQLFRDLFTKFPSYKHFFTNIPDLDLERMHENKRLLKHATKVIETVSFVVDSVGDESKANDLNEALLNLVKGHLKRKVGTLEFKNLGIVLVDFICNVNNQRGVKKNPQLKEEGLSSMKKLDEKSPSHVSSVMMDESATMTDALDKLRKLSSSATSLTDNDSQKSSGDYNIDNRQAESTTTRIRASIPSTADRTNCNSSTTLNNEQLSSSNIRSSIPTGLRSNTIDKPNIPINDRGCDERMPLDTNSLVAAWTKLYGVILGLVEREEMLLQEQIQPAFETAN